MIGTALALRLRVALLALCVGACGVPALAVALWPGSPAQEVRAAAAEARAAGRERFEVRFGSPELAANVQGNGGVARAVVRLPPAAERCRAGAERCWLILFLPGFDGSPERAMELLAPRLAELERAGASPPAVLVAVDGRTRLGGGFYVDSPASGRFATMLLDRLLPALRAELGLDLPPERTLIVGHSAGGFGALWLSLARPSEFAGAAAFAPAARTVPLAEELLASVERARAGTGLDPAAMIRDPDPQRFRERLLWAMCAAFLPAPERQGGIALPFDPAHHPWRFSESSRAGLARFDLGRPLDGGPALGARALRRILVTGGGRDRLIPAADVLAVAAALSAARGPGRGVKCLIRPDADHASALADDFAEAVRYLTSPG